VSAVSFTAVPIQGQQTIDTEDGRPSHRAALWCSENALEPAPYSGAVPRLLVGFMVAALLASCSSDSPSTSEPSGTITSTPTTTPTPTPLPPTPTPTSNAIAGGPGPSRIEPATGPADLAARVVAAERVARDPKANPGALAATAFELQQLYRQLGRAPRWDKRVLAATPRQLRLTVRANASARREFRGLTTRLSDRLPAWRIVKPAPLKELLGYYRKAEARFGVPWEVLAAINLVETGMGRIRGTSVAGAQGPMQFIPSTWAAYGAGGNVNDPHDAIMGAARYLAHNGAGRGRIDNALYRYNNSTRYVRGVKHYASVITQDPAALRSYYHWQIVYASTVGDIWLPVGYERTQPISVRRYLRANPAHHLASY
jgi:Transglycosylase SLT domain